MTTKSVRTTDLPDDLLHEIAESLAWYSVGIWGTRNGTTKELGSGTLVQVGKIHGVLTARHVVDRFDGKDEIGLSILKTRHRFAIKTDFLGEPISCAKGPTEDSGPDIAFFRLPDADVGTVGASKSFVNLELCETKAADHPIENGIWCIFGFPSELGSAENGESRHFFGQAGAGSVPEDYVLEEPFDYCWMLVQYSASNDLPKNYGGASGGGLWQVIVQWREGRVEIGDLILRGVVFYQSIVTNDERRLRCHAHKSIYSYVAGKIREHYG